MKKRLIIASLLPMLILPFSSELSYSQPVSKEITVQQNIHNLLETKQIQPEIDPDVSKVSKITGWNYKLSAYFVSEARIRNVSIFEEAIPLIAVETRHTFASDKVHKNTNGTFDKGVFQINDVTHRGIMKQLKVEGRQFDSWSRLNPEYNIAAGMFWIGYLKSKGLEGHQLFTSYNRGEYGAEKYAKRNGTYVSNYSREVEKAKNDLLKV